jgi:ATP-dependent Clp protease adaptor protein ClpS
MTSKELKRNPKRFSKRESGDNMSLILHNDDIHSFDFVIEALIEICGHDYLQATQCAFITHYKGSCDIRRGNLESLQPLKDALVLRGLITTID